MFAWRPLPLESSGLQGLTVTYQVDALQDARTEGQDGNGKFDHLVKEKQRPGLRYVGSTKTR